MKAIERPNRKVLKTFKVEYLNQVFTYTSREEATSRLELLELDTWERFRLWEDGQLLPHNFMMVNSVLNADGVAEYAPHPCEFPFIREC